MRVGRDRRARGAYETPPAVVRFLCRQALVSLLQDDLHLPAGWSQSALDGDGLRRVSLSRSEAERAFERLRATTFLDPAAGTGAFLVGMVEEMVSLAKDLLAPYHPFGETDEAHLRRELARGSLHGVEIRAEAISECVSRLEALVGPDVAFQLKCADSLAQGFDWAREFADAVQRQGGFDIVIGNPPYVNMVEMDSRPSIYDRGAVRSRFGTARGGFDLFVPFTELALDLVRPGGFLSFLTPNKILCAEYAASLRHHLVERASLAALCDLSAAAPFPGTGAYPVSILMRKGREEGRSVSIYRGVGKGGRLEIRRFGTMPNPAMKAGAVRGLWTPHLDQAIGPALDAVLRAPETIGSVCTVRGAATVAEAYRIAPQLGEGTGRTRAGRFLVSGTIERYGNRWGKKAARILGRSLTRPVLEDIEHVLSRNRLAQARSAKIVLSGLARRPTAFWDARGDWVAGKSTVLLYDSRVDLAYLCGLLNSDLYRGLYAALFGGLALAGGYLRFGPPQLSRLPFLDPGPRRMARIAQRVREIQEEKAAARPSDERVAELDAKINALAWEAAHAADGPLSLPRGAPAE